MQFFLTAAGLILLLIPPSAGGRAQVRDSLSGVPSQSRDSLGVVYPRVPGPPGAVRPAVLPDTGATRDTSGLRQLRPDVFGGAGRDTAMRRDSTLRQDTSLHRPLGGIGSIPGDGLPAALLPDTALNFIAFRSAGDMLREFEGVFVSGTGIGGFRRKFSVDGMRDGALIFLADGLLLNNPSTGLYLDADYPVDYAGVIEFAPPFPGSSGGAGGTVDFVSHSRRAPRPVSRIRYTQSSYGYSLLDGTLSQDVIRGLNVALGLQRPVSDGRFVNSGFDAWGGRVKLRYDMDGAAVYASEIFNRRERGLNDGISFSTPESLRYEPIRAIVVNPSAAEKLLRHDLSAGAAIGRDGGDLTTFDLELTSSHREYRDEAGDTGSTGTPFREIRDEQSSGFRIGHSHDIGGNRLLLGVEMRNRRLLKDPNIGSYRSTQTSVSGSLVINAGSFLSVSPAARLDRFLERQRISAGASVSLRIGGGIQLTGSVSRSHRFPSFAEAYGVRGLAHPLGSPDPERHDMISGGLFAGDSAGTFASVSVLHRKISGTITLDSAGGVPGDPPLAWQRSGDESRTGFSCSTALRAGSFLAELAADYLSYGSGTRRRYAPAWDLTGGVYFRDRVVGGHLNLKAGFRARYFSSWDGEGYAERYELFVPSPVEIPPAGTVDFVLFAGIGDAVIHFIWENLLDRRYFMTVLYPMDDRAVRFGLTWDFFD